MGGAHGVRPAPAAGPTGGAPWRAILATHEVEPLPDDVTAEIYAVIERYARSVGAPEARVHWQDKG